MKKLGFILILFALISWPLPIRAAGGIYASGGGSKTAGETFTISVTASGTNFDSLQGIISVSGPVTIVSFNPGSATWLPGKTPSNGGAFVGIVSERSSLTVATITLRGRTPGSGAVSVSGVRLADKGSVVGDGAGGASFTITKAPQYPSDVKVSSTTHPNQDEFYDQKTITLSWNKDSGISGFSYLLDKEAGTVPPTKVTSSDSSVTYENQEIGTYYFHIRSVNSDGWGGTTHFKINIKEPDPKVDEALPKPTNIQIIKDSPFTNNIDDGTLKGIKISGQTLPNYVANLNFEPLPALPEGYKDTSIDTAVKDKNTQPLSLLVAVANDQGYFEKTLDFPVKAGFYKLSIQGQSIKTLTPISDSIKFQVSIKNGGTVELVNDIDQFEPAPPAPLTTWDKTKTLLLDRNFQYGGGGLIIILALGIVGIVWWRKKRLLN